MLKIILIIHRYLGVLLGILMTLWCLSGFVMMYQGYPSTTGEERLRGLPSLGLRDCCSLSDQQISALNTQDFRIKSLNGKPILRLKGSMQAGEVINLQNSEAITSFAEAEILEIARNFANGNDIRGKPSIDGIIDIDQWTVQTARRNAPVYKVKFDDPRATEIYIAGNRGQVIQDTNRRERLLTWLGAIPHWLYPLQLRQNGPLWSKIVIWTSLIGTFLTLTGLYVGITRLRRRSTDGKLVSPFRGWWYWHHMAGLFFGTLVLTWVFSGLLTMNPWGWLAGDFGMFRYRDALIGTPDPAGTRRFLGNLPSVESDDFVRLETAPFDGEFYMLATHRDGSHQRLNAQGVAVELKDSIINSALSKLPVPIKDVTLMNKEDQYYYAYKSNDLPLPVYRAILDDEEQTRLYINPITGNIATVDATQRLNRWTRVGLHRLDFSFMKARPVWDILVVLLLAGVTLVCITGTWMSSRRIGMDSRLLSKKFATKQTTPDSRRRDLITK